MQGAILPDILRQKYVMSFCCPAKPGTLAGENGSIAQWRGKIYDPENKTVYDSGWQTDPKAITPYSFTNKSTSGKWIFELTVKDQLGNESKASQTFLTVFLDESDSAGCSEFILEWDLPEFGLPWLPMKFSEASLCLSAG